MLLHRALSVAVLSSVLFHASGCEPTSERAPPAPGGDTKAASATKAPSDADATAGDVDAAAPGDARSALQAKLVPPGANGTAGSPTASSPTAGIPASGTPTTPGGATTNAAAETSKEGPLTSAAPPGSQLDEKEAREAFTRFAEELGAAISAGDRAAAERHLLGDADLANVFRPNATSIVGSTLVATNRKTLGVLLDSLGGKKLERAGRSGPILYASDKGLLREHIPVMRQASLDLFLDGAIIPVSLPQLVWTDSQWKVFQLEL